MKQPKCWRWAFRMNRSSSILVVGISPSSFCSHFDVNYSQFNRFYALPRVWNGELNFLNLTFYDQILNTSLVGWLKRSLSQSIGSFSCNPHFALFLPGQRLDIFGNVSNHWGMVTYNFFWNFFFGSLIRTCTGSFANVFEGTSPLYMKVGQILRLSENGSWALVDARHFFFVGH